MKQLTRLAAAIGLAAGALAATPAFAATICSNCAYSTGDATFLGVHNPATFDTSGFRRDGINLPTGTFVQDTWLFTLNPAGNVQINANFIPFDPMAFANFTVTLYNVTLSGTCATAAVGAGCAGADYTIGSTIASNTAAADNARINPVALTAGNYAFRVTFTTNQIAAGDQATYSGQLRTSEIPEPGSLALAGLALMGVAATVRRRRA